MNDDLTPVRPGSDIVGPTRKAVRKAIEDLPEDLSWDELSSNIRPVFVRRRPLPPGAEKPLAQFIAPVGEVAIGVDIGPAFMYVGESVLERWSKTFDEAMEVALVNLRAAFEAEKFVEVEYGVVADVPVWWYQSTGGLASGLLLVEPELVKRYGDEPRVLAAPMRNLLLAAPFDADRELVAWLRDEIAAEDPNGLALPLFALVDGKLTIDVQGQKGVVQ
jgi:hypothetical protein